MREFPSEITRDVASIQGCVYSSVSATRAMFGDRAPAFEAELSQALLRLNPSGVFKERIETALFLAPKATADSSSPRAQDLEQSPPC